MPRWCVGCSAHLPLAISCRDGREGRAAATTSKMSEVQHRVPAHSDANTRSLTVACSCLPGLCAGDVSGQIIDNWAMKGNYRDLKGFHHGSLMFCMRILLFILWFCIGLLDCWATPIAYGFLNSYDLPRRVITRRSD